jgi:hypothetical protein
MSSYSLIKNIYLPGMTNSSFLHFMSSFYDYILTVKPEDLGIADNMASFKKHLDEMTDVVKLQAASPESKQLKALDEQRDMTVKHVIHIIDAALESPIAAEKDAAAVLVTIIDGYRKITTMTYRDETANITGLLFDLKKTENAALVTTLGLSAATTQLGEMNTQFEKLLEKREAAFGNEEKALALRVRADLQKDFTLIVHIVNAKSVLEPSEAITTFINSVNGMIDYTRASIKQSKSQKKKKEDKKDDSTKPADPTTDATSETKSEPTVETPIVTTDKDGVTTAGRPPAEATPETETPQK